jgi:hypothetical protein
VSMGPEGTHAHRAPGLFSSSLRESSHLHTGHYSLLTSHGSLLWWEGPPWKILVILGVAEVKRCELALQRQLVLLAIQLGEFSCLSPVSTVQPSTVRTAERLHPTGFLLRSLQLLSGKAAVLRSLGATGGGGRGGGKKGHCPLACGSSQRNTSSHTRYQSGAGGSRFRWTWMCGVWQQSAVLILQPEWTPHAGDLALNHMKVHAFPSQLALT